MDQFKKSTVRKRQLSPSKAQSLLKEEIMQLQRELECQTTLRNALEKAMNCQQPLLDDDDHPSYISLSQPAEDLIKEIALLELEVTFLEKYLLSLYRKSFEKTLPSPPLRPRQNQRKIPEVSKGDDSDALAAKFKEVLGAESLVENGIDRSQSSLSHYSAHSFRAPSSPSEAFHESLDLYHSLPLAMLEKKQDSAGITNPTVGSSLRIRETPNYLSEEMIKCISTIYCHLSDPPVIDQSIPCFSSSSSPPSFTFSPLKNRDDAFNSSRENPSFSSWARQVESSEEFNESVFAMAEVRGLCKSPDKLDVVRGLLQKHRSLISSLAHIDPGKLKHEDKLAFWINIHNSLAMHAFLVHGIPRGSLKRVSLVLKAAYNIGGQTVSIDTIQNSILGCRLPRPTQWLHSLFFPRMKFKAGDVRRSFAIKHPEARLRFALCSGCRSDPAVRLYTSKAVFQELEMAKEEYVQMNVKPHKEQRLLIPKNIECFIKETGLAASGFIELLEHSIPEELREDYQKLQRGKLMRRIDWMPHDFSFGFLLSTN